MAIYTNASAQAAAKHGVFRSSKLRATDVGKIYDLVLEEDVDNGVAVKVGDPTHDGLQMRAATIAAKADKVAITGSVALIKEAFTKAQASEEHFYNKAGEPVKAYALEDDMQGEIFGVAEYQFTKVTNADGVSTTLDAYVVVDGKGGYQEVASLTAANGYGFIGRVYGYETSDTFDKIVLIEVVQNKQITA